MAGAETRSALAGVRWISCDAAPDDSWQASWDASWGASWDAALRRSLLAQLARRLVGASRAAAARHPLFWGVLLMLAATSLWALAFAAPLAASNASAVEIALGRFIAYGLLSLALLGGSRLRALPAGLLRRAVLYALIGNIAYYALLVLGIQLAGAAMAILVIGLLPVTLSLAGFGGRLAAAWRALAAPFAVFAAGVLLLNAAKTDFFRDLGAVSAAGLACLFAALAMWTWYALDNARFLARRAGLSGADWSSIVGVASLAISLVALPLAWAMGLARDPTTLSLGELSEIALWSLALGVGATWLGAVLFNIASRLLDTAILGQLIVFEAVFGILYVAMVQGTAPPWTELAAIALALAGVLLSIRALQRL